MKERNGKHVRCIVPWMTMLCVNAYETGAVPFWMFHSTDFQTRIIIRILFCACVGAVEISECDRSVEKTVG